MAPTKKTPEKAVLEEVVPTENAEVQAEVAAPKAPAKRETPAETETIGEFVLQHLGHGKYAIEGQNKEFGSRQDALSYIEDLKVAAAFQEKYGDIVPDGVEIHTRNVEFRGTLTELPMNELYLPDGTHNPHYDRGWVWGWGRATGDDISTKQARGYRVVTRDVLEELVEEGLVPRHYQTLLMPVDHGNRLLYGDLVLMRIPRVLWRQRQAAKEKLALRRVAKTDEDTGRVFDDAGVRNASGPVSNELSSGLKMSGF